MQSGFRSGALAMITSGTFTGLSRRPIAIETQHEGILASHEPLEQMCEILEGLLAQEATHDKGRPQASGGNWWAPEQLK